jgi:sporulation protein YlmC with PRC-barrel domain
MKQLCSGLSSSALSSNSLRTRREVLHRWLGALWLSVALSVTASAQDGQWTIETTRLGLMKQASTLIGCKSLDQNGKSVGKIREILLDLHTGELLVTLIAAPKSELIPVPATSYLMASKGHFVIGTERKALKTAPRIPKTSVAFGLDASSLAPSFQFFNRTLASSPDLHSRLLCTGTGLLGTPLLSSQRELLGKVKDIEVDLLHGRIVYLLIEPAPGVAAPDELIAVPPVLAQPDPAGRALVLASDRTHFAAGPRFTKAFSTDIVFPEMAKRICRHYGLEAALASMAELANANPANNQTRGQVQRPDDQITQAVLGELIRRRTWSVLLEVSVTTRHGRVTITGKVKDQKQKAELVAAAERVAGAGNVEDRIEVLGKKIAQL